MTFFRTKLRTKIDTIEKTISNLFKLIKNKRIAIIYYTEYGFNSENENWKDSKTNKLGKVLESKNIKYEYLDITERELGQWEKMLQVEQEFNDKFEGEGNKLMFDVTIEEAKCLSKQYAKSGGKRFRYICYR